jgi:hypothetical protein
MKRTPLRPGKKCGGCDGQGCSECKGRGFIIKPKKRAKIKPIASKRHALNLEYGKLRKEFLKNRPRCEILQPSGRICGKEATDLHHRKGRGCNFLAVGTFFPACRECHDLIHQSQTGWARRMGYLVNQASKNEIEDPSKIFLPYEEGKREEGEEG